MSFLMQHGKELFVFCLVPPVALLMDYLLRRWVTLLIFFLTGLGCLPLIWKYDYILPYIGQLTEVACLAALYALLFRPFIARVRLYVSIVLAVILFFVFGLIALIGSLAGGSKTLHKWETGKYEILHKSDAGFAGRPHLYYELHEHSVHGLLVKKIDIASEVATANQCEILFSGAKLLFNQCESTMKTTP